MPVPATASSSSSKNLWTAASEGDLERVKHLIDSEGFTATSPDPNTYTPVHAAASYGHLELLRYLLNLPSSKENDAANVTDEDGDTPLFVAETVETAKCLIDEFGADPKHKNNAGETAAETAEENEHAELAAYLRGLTGEEPLYQNPSLAEDDAAEGAEGTGNPELDAALDQKTDELMSRVREIMERAQARGAASGEDLTPEEEEELRNAVGEQLMSQIKEGWVQAQEEEEEAAAAPQAEEAAAAGQESQSSEASEGTSPNGPAR